jgi:hypothetical protein
VEISLNTKTRLSGKEGSWSLASFSCLSSFPHLIVKIQIFFLCMCWRRMLCFSGHSPWETNLKSIPFKVVQSSKQCSCDVITERSIVCVSTSNIITTIYIHNNIAYSQLMSICITILVPRASRPHASSLGPGTHRTGTARKLALISNAHGN